VFREKDSKQGDALDGSRPRKEVQENISIAKNHKRKSVSSTAQKLSVKDVTEGGVEPEK